MPTYDYQCDQCGRTFEVRQRITDEPLTRCETCGGPLRRLLSPAPFILKGEGWYVTDYPSEARKKAMRQEKSSTPTAGSTASSSPSSSSGSESSAVPSKSKSSD